MECEFGLWASELRIKSALGYAPVYMSSHTLDSKP